MGAFMLFMLPSVSRRFEGAGWAARGRGRGGGTSKAWVGGDSAVSRRTRLDGLSRLVEGAGWLAGGG